MPEHEHRQEPGLPPEWLEALREPAYACLTVGTDQGTAFVIKAPRVEIERVRGRVPIELVHELYDHPAAPVIRMSLRIYDDPLAPLVMESFINVWDPVQRDDYAAFATQPEIPLLFYDEVLEQRLTKRITNSASAVVPEVLAATESLLARIPSERFSFERAKRAVQEATSL